MKILPVKVGLVHAIGKNKHVDASFHKLTTKHVEALSKGLKLTEARFVDLHSNQINDIAGTFVLRNLNRNILSLNLEANLLGRGNHFMDLLCEGFTSKTITLRELNLAQNQISDE